MSDKNLPPTERKRRQAALEGQAPRSKILTASTAVVIAVTVIASTSTALSRRMIDWATHLLSLREINVDRSIGEPRARGAAEIDAADAEAQRAGQHDCRGPPEDHHHEEDE